MKLADGVISARYRNQFHFPEFMEPRNYLSGPYTTTKLSHTFLKGHLSKGVTITSSASNFIFPNRNTKDVVQQRGNSKRVIITASIGGGENSFTVSFWMQEIQ